MFPVEKSPTMDVYKKKFITKRRDDKSWMRKETWDGNDGSELDMSRSSPAKFDTLTSSEASIENKHEGSRETVSNWIGALIAPYSPIKVQQKKSNSPPIKSWEQLKNIEASVSQRGIDDVYDNKLEESDEMVFHNVVQSIGSGRSQTPNSIPRIIMNLYDPAEPTTVPVPMDETTITSSVVKKSVFPDPRKKRSSTPPSNYFHTHGDIVEQAGIMTIGITDTIPTSSAAHRMDVIPVASPHRRLSSFKKVLFGQRQEYNNNKNNLGDVNTSAEERKSGTTWKTSGGVGERDSSTNQLTSSPRSIANIVAALAKDHLTVDAASTQDIEWYVVFLVILY